VWRGDLVSDPQPAPPQDEQRRSRRWRLVALAVAIVATLVVARATGVHESLTLDGIRAKVTAAGAWGALGFLALFVVGELLHVPGLVFIGAALTVWGPLQGGALGALGALLSLVTSFVVVRAIGGTALEDVRSGLLRRVLDGLERRPIATVALARAILILSPPVTYALALSGIRFRDYFIGSAIGLVPPLTLVVVLFDRLSPWLFGR
jgi:uncharacterized membrane protein YdjX (TVP38/TMEM64 family)